MATNPEVGAKWAILVAVRDIERMPDGTSVPPELAHTLLVLAMYWPRIWPSQEALAAQLKIEARGVNKRLRRLEDAGLISRRPGGKGRNTRYGLALKLIRSLGPEIDCPGGPEILSWGTHESIDSIRPTEGDPLSYVDE